MVYILRFCIWNITEIKQQKPLFWEGVSVRWSCWKGGLKIIYRFWDVRPGKTMLNKTMLDSTIGLGNVSIE